ncbi:glycosyltransferase family 2 protein [Candidatus Dependentiae bacterium]|nr:glycosyltransferase family 2 protein [Candidatus Dependentiae bacterium]
MQLSVIIPNFNGKKLFEKTLPLLLSELQSVESYEVIIVDDSSTDDSVKYLKENFKNEIRVLKLKINSGFSKACNIGIETASGDYVLLINNDVVIKEAFINNLLQHFNKQIFAVVPSIKLPGEKCEEEGFTVISFSNGDLSIKMPNEKGLEFKIKEPTFIPHAVAACAVYDRQKILKLGMFDEMFSPYFWEDVDLSLKALKLGWKIIYDPSVKVMHKKSKTVKKYYKFTRRFIVNLRNRLLCTWSHLDSDKLIKKHFIYLTYLYEKGRVLKDKNILIGLNLAFEMLNEIALKRKRIKHKISMEKIIKDYSLDKYEKDFNNNSVL